MASATRPIDEVVATLQERVKELGCLYRVDEILQRHDTPPQALYRAVLEAMPAGWQYPADCRPALDLEGQSYRLPGFEETPWVQRAAVRVHGRVVGELAVYYAEEKPPADVGPFLTQEQQLLEALAERIAFHLVEREHAGEPADEAVQRLPARAGKWQLIIEFLQRMDPHLLEWITRKMLHHLRWRGVDISALVPALPAASDLAAAGDENRPLSRAAIRDAVLPTAEVFRVAAQHLREEEILRAVQRWISQERVNFLIAKIEDQGSSTGEITQALERLHHLGITEAELPRAVHTMLRVALSRRLFTDQLEFINIAKGVVTLADFHELGRHLLHPPHSHGKLGGKAAGLFLAHRVVETSVEHDGVLRDIRVPRTWYIASDAVLEFIRYNHLEEVYDRKYMDIGQVRLQYPYVVQAFKAAAFPPSLSGGLGAVLDDLGDRPLIVRSSSLLEDRTGASFAGKYRSVFLANQGTRQERLRALEDAVAEVYASIFGPDPIEYRADRNLLDVHEEMGIMIQEVVGRRVGRYFLPAFAGVAFSNNEFRWSPRIRRDDGLVRLVVGLGTRAVDRLSDDYPVLLAPGQPGLRANATTDEVLRYAPRMADVIDLEKNSFTTVPIDELLRECGNELPLIRKIVSIAEDGRIRRPGGLGIDFDAEHAVVTFEGLAAETPFVSQMATLLRVLQSRFGTPVDIEFASDGRHLFLLQCRPQSRAAGNAPVPIPRDVPPENVLFSAHRYVSSGRVRDITHIGYVVPEQYAQLAEEAQLRDVGRAVGRLNQLLPKRQFILMGPGRWGSRGDIRLGVGVTYSEINNAAVLVEIARRKGNYVPDLSFGTHFFQDLVEAEIRYLPLYPDEPGNQFNEAFLGRARNLFPELVPEYAHLAEVVRVIDVPAETGGRILRVLMNGDAEEALGLFAEPRPAEPLDAAAALGWPEPTEPFPDDHWRWRLHAVQQLAAQLDAARFGVAGLWVFGSTENGTAGPESDIDLIVQVDGSESQRRDLLLWLDGWSRALAEMNYLRTGHRTEGLLDVHLVTADDIQRRSGYAAKIGAVTDPAKRIA